MDSPLAPGARVMFGASKDELGQWWVVVTHTGPGMQFTYSIPLDSADEVADGYSESIKETAKVARRERSGLVVAGGSSAPTFNRSREAARRTRQP